MCNSKDGNIDLRDIDLASLFTCSATSDNNSSECHDLNKPPAYHAILYKTINPLTAGTVHIPFFTFFINTLHISF